jgi:hypothetical protein
VKLIEGGNKKKRRAWKEPLNLGACFPDESDDFVIGVAVGVLRLKIQAAIALGTFTLKHDDCGFTLVAPLIAEAKLQQLADWMNVELSVYRHYFDGEPDNAGKCLYVVTPQKTALTIIKE